MTRHACACAGAVLFATGVLAGAARGGQGFTSRLFDASEDALILTDYFHANVHAEGPCSGPVCIFHILNLGETESTTGPTAYGP